jgi:diphthine methyl ester synthase
MLYLIGLGLNEKSLSKEGLDAVKKCDKVYLENYTVEFPYAIEKLKLRKKIEKLGRSGVESDKLIEESNKENVALLVYGSPLFATTHSSLLKELKGKVKVIFNASIFDAVAGTGLQLYKFGKIASMPTWLKNYEPDSFIDIVIGNKKIDAHTLILVDIGLHFADSLNQLVEAAKRKKLKLDKIIVCSRMGINDKIYYESIDKLKRRKIESPYCLIVPGKLHFMEGELL